MVVGILWSKGKYFSNVCRLVGGVAPLLILMKHWLFFSFFVVSF